MTREESILSLANTVSYTAGRFYRRARNLPGVGLPEIEAAAWLGAITAVDRFDPAHGAKLATFAEPRIHGAIRDYLRSLDYLSRSHRGQVKSGLRPPVICFSIDQTSPGDLPWSGPSERALRDHQRLEARLDVAALMKLARLPKRTREVLRRRFFNEETNGEIARALGIHESRVSQIGRSGLDALRAAA